MDYEKSLEDYKRSANKSICVDITTVAISFLATDINCVNVDEDCLSAVFAPDPFYKKILKQEACEDRRRTYRQCYAAACQCVYDHLSTFCEISVYFKGRVLFSGLNALNEIGSLLLESNDINHEVAYLLNTIREKLEPDCWHSYSMYIEGSSLVVTKHGDNRILEWYEDKINAASKET